MEETASSPGPSLNNTSSMVMCEHKEVRFALTPTFFIIPNDLTQDEIERCWWTKCEIRGTRKVCQWIAKESRKLPHMIDCMDALYSLTKANATARESNLLASGAARRLVQYSSKSVLLRGLERQVCDKLRLRPTKYTAGICRLHRQGVADEHLRRVSESHSRVHRIVARLLGEADANHQENLRLSELRLEDTGSSSIFLQNLVGMHKPERRCMVNSICLDVQRSPQCRCP